MEVSGELHTLASVPM